MKRIVILGSTGSIGINTLKIAAKYPKRFKVVGLSAYNNVRLLEKQMARFKPRMVAVRKEKTGLFKKRVSRLRILDVDRDLEEMVTAKDVDLVVIGMRGSAALPPFLAAVRAGKHVAPANKEALVIAGALLMKEARKSGARIIPIDSEQSAIFQCLQGQNRKEVAKILLTASGGALLRVPAVEFNRLSVQKILKHPRWRMGKKITVDSATLMNKGFEVIEAKRLFDLDVKDIEVVIHPEAIVHSMVEYKDGSILAQLSVTDMRIPIQYAMTYPQRWPVGLKRLRLNDLGRLHFEPPDFKKFPALPLCFEVARKDGTLPSVLNAADEEAVEAFLQEKISFTKIYRIVEKVCRKHKVKRNPALADIYAAETWARETARKEISKG